MALVLQAVEDGVLRLVQLQVLGAEERLGKDGLAAFGAAARAAAGPGSHHAVSST